MSHAYIRGDIVRFGDTWGVVRRVGFAHGPMVDWWTGQYASGCVEEWYCQGGCMAKDLSVAFAHDYAGIPDEVLAKATFYKLVSEDC